MSAAHKSRTIAPIEPGAFWEGTVAFARTPGGIVNILSRLAILAFTVDALVNANSEKFAGKALGPRNVGILIGMSMLFPILHFIYKRWTDYPVWYDNLYLSIYWLDMSGNSLNLYNTVEWWDHIPHFHGPGALSMVLIGAFGLAPLAAAGLATILHLVLEVNEYYGDVILGTHNVRGIADSMNDLSYGLLGVLVYTIIAKRSVFLRLRRTRPRKARR
ncbi:MAG TPA: hypothetical protein VM052_00745 [Candidatus Limnocylindrales bacterium]|nr:hypothetical protein [Candidatus Limnocylindrales bacterium]